MAYVAGFAEGTGAHAIDLLRGGLHAYAGFAPLALQVFFVGLVVLDPLVVVSLSRMRPGGARLAGIVMAADMAANWWVAWPSLRDDPSRLLRPVGLPPITVFGMFVLVTAMPLRRSLSGAGSLDGRSE